MTDQDMRDQVKLVLASDAPDFDVKGIVDDIQRDHGTVDINTVTAEKFWAIVAARAVR